MKTKWTSSVIPLAVLALLAAGCHGKKKEQAARPPTAVTVVVANQADVPVTMSSFGRLRALNDVDIKAQVSGVIAAAPFVEGATVNAGDVLFKIEKDSYQAQLDQAMAQQSGATASLKQSQETLERNRKLKDQNLISQEDFDQLVTAVDAASAQVALYKASVEQAQISLNYCTVTSPVSGVTGKRMVDPGNLVSADGSTLVNVRTVDPLYVDYSVTEVELPRIRKAMAAGPVPVMVFLGDNAGSSGIFKGTLKLMDNSVDEQSGTIALRAVVDNGSGQLWPGQFVYVFPVIDVVSNAVLVPQSAVAEGKDGPYAFVVKDNKVELRSVEIGPEVGEALVVTKGIAKGDQVVTKGQLGLWPGAAVTIVTETDDQTAKTIKKREQDPSVIAIVNMMAQRKVDTSKIAMFVGLPEDSVKKLLDADANSGVNPDNAMLLKMHKGGMSNQEIAQITGMSEAEVQQSLDGQASGASTSNKL